MMYFDIGDKRFHLRHHNDDDSRSVVACGDVNFTKLLSFNSSLRILKEGKDVGHLRVDHDTDKWTLVTATGVADLDVPCKDYGWQELALAEVTAAALLLKADLG